MPIPPTEHDSRVDNSPPECRTPKNAKRGRLVRNRCINHEYRSRAKRMGQVAKFCALCMDQQEMAARWKKIRKALATIRCCTRKSSAAAKATSIPTANTQWEVSIVRTAAPATSTEGLRVLVVMN